MLRRALALLVVPFVVACQPGTSNNPVANAGPDQSVNSGQSVTLDGTASTPAGAALSYAWTQTAGTTVSLSSASAPKPTFTAPSVTASAILAFELRVVDSNGSATST